MKKNSLLAFVLLALFACHNHTDNDKQLQARIDSLETRLADTYKPGFGEFMSSIQIHHAKLWFAGQNQNWKLADFEINEIKESLDDISKYCTDRIESKSLEMIKNPLDSVGNAIQHQNLQQFKSTYILLTNTCNNCHQQTEHEFNVITIPKTPPVSNQKF